MIGESDIEEEDQCVTDYRAGCYSPKLFTSADIDDIDAVIYDPLDDIKKLELARKQVKSTGRVTVSISNDWLYKVKKHCLCHMICTNIYKLMDNYHIIKHY